MSGGKLVMSCPGADHAKFPHTRKTSQALEKQGLPPWHTLSFTPIFLRDH
jgi:hypothetical protein